MKRYVVLSDIQIPFQDDSALEVAYKLIKDVKPDGVILNGDIVDCVTPDTKVLTYDLQWKEAASLTVGEDLIGFDEYSAGLKTNGRRKERYLRKSTLTGAAAIKVPCYKLTLESGETLVSSAKHQWLGWPSTKNRAVQEWMYTEGIHARVLRGSPVMLHRPVRPWAEMDGRDRGYLEAAFDGEGHVTFHKRANNFGHVGFSQKPGPFIDKVRSLLEKYGFDTNTFSRNPDDVKQLVVNGGMWEHARLIGMLRMPRFVEKWVKTAPIDGYAFRGAARERVVAAEDVGEQWVISMRTSTSTFLANGFSSHNCYSISDFDKDPYSQANLEVEIEGACDLMGKLSTVPNKLWIGGNHEDRWRRVIWKRGSPYKTMFRSFAEAFRMANYGFWWKPYGGYVLLGKLMVTHGSMVSKHSGQTAKAHYDKYGRSVLVGHTHRLGSYYHRNMEGDYVAFENGCLCSLYPEYTQHPDWQHGFSVVEVGEKGLFHVTQCPILRRTTCFYGATQYSI